MDLLESAKHLHPRLKEYWSNQKTRQDTQRHMATFMMLCGFAIEDLLKATIILVKRKALEDEIDRTSGLPDSLKTHKLNALASEAGLEQELKPYHDLLERLTRAATWQGRYPCPIFPEHWEMKDPFGVAGDQWVPMNSYCSKDPDGILEIVSRIVKTMNAQPPPPPYAPPAAGVASGEA